MVITRYGWQFDAVCIALAVIGGFLAGAVDFNNDEPQAAVIVIVAFTGLLGFIQPRKAWRWALIVAGLVSGISAVSRSGRLTGFSLVNVQLAGSSFL